MTTQKAIRDGIPEGDAAHSSRMEEIFRIGNFFIIGASAFLALGNAVSPAFNLWWIVLGGALGATLRGWQIRKVPKA